MKNLTHISRSLTAILAAALAATTATPVFAAIITVPTDQPTIAAAIVAAASNDEIRVQSTHAETSTGNIVNGKNLTIASYDAGYTTPTTGAVWTVAAGGGSTTGAIQLTGATMTFSGFGQFSTTAASAFYLGAGATLTVNNTTFSGIGTSNTAAVQANTVADIHVTVNNCTFTGNGRSLWYQNTSSSSSMAINDSTFTTHTSSPIEFRTLTGTHTFSMNRSTFTHAVAAAIRLYAFGTTAGGLTNNTLTMDRNIFITTAPNSAPIAFGGTSDTANAASTFDFTITNSIFDIRNAAAAAHGMSTLSAAGTPRRSNITVRHCTVIQGSAGQSGFQSGTDSTGTWLMENNIIDGPGFAYNNSGLQTMTSGKNLLNTAAGTSTGTNVAGIVLSGTEITGTSPAFVDRAAGDFHLTLGSPAIDVGTSLGVAFDYDAISRPQGSGPDLGAYEFPIVTAIGEWNLYR